MDFSFSAKRRTVLKLLAGGSTISLGVSSLPVAMAASPMPIGHCAPTPTTGLAGMPAWAPQPGVAKWRIDGMCKVMGKKIYARDFHAADLKDQGWPGTEQFLLAIRCNSYDKYVMGYNLDMLPADLKPSVVIDAALLRTNKIGTPSGMAPFLASLPANGRASPPAYFGQPVAMLIFDSYTVYRRAKKILQFNDKVVQYSDKITDWGSLIAPTQITTFGPLTSYVRNDKRSFNLVARRNSPNYLSELTANANEVRRDISQSGWKTFTSNFYTPAYDPVFMEPESGMGWYNPATSTLNLLLGTQSPTGDIAESVAIFSGSNFAVKNVELMACYPGGGFGGRDSSFFTPFLAMASVFAKGPLRWQQDRFEQFQIGLKRQETIFNQTLALDKNGVIKAMDTNFTVSGGAQKNLNPYVAQLAALSAASCYDIAQVIATGSATNTPQLSGGSQRGFGGPQAYMAIETLLDQAALSLKIDPFALRRKNLLAKGKGKIVTGAPVLQDLQLPELMRRLESHVVWQSRKARQREMAKKGLLYGVGFALSNQAYGTSGDGMFGAVQILPDGSLQVHTPYIDMGNGAATALGLAPAAWLGRNANTIAMGEAAMFTALGLSTSVSAGDKYVIKLSGSSSACLGAFHQYHAVENAGLSLLLQTVLPALNAIWKNSVPHTVIVWKDGAASAPGLPPVTWAKVLEYVFANKLPTVVAAHATTYGAFATAHFAFPGGGVKLDADYVASGTNPSQLTAVPRNDLVNPPQEAASYGRYAYSPCGALVALTVEKATGKVRVEKVISALSAGKLHCPQVVQGQSEGGIAMAIGDVLLGGCPNDHTGPGNGVWNFNQYSITKWGDIPQQELIILPPASGETSARGIAESVMCPIAPAILNALAMATGGKRFTELPVTSKTILEALA